MSETDPVSTAKDHAYTDTQGHAGPQSRRAHRRGGGEQHLRGGLEGVTEHEELGTMVAGAELVPQEALDRAMAGGNADTLDQGRGFSLGWLGWAAALAAAAGLGIFAYRAMSARTRRGRESWQPQREGESRRQGDIRGDWY